MARWFQSLGIILIVLTLSLNHTIMLMGHMNVMDEPAGNFVLGAGHTQTAHAHPFQPAESAGMNSATCMVFCKSGAESSSAARLPFEPVYWIIEKLFSNRSLTHEPPPPKSSQV